MLRRKERVLAAEMSIADGMIERNYANREGEREKESGEKEIGWIRSAKGARVSTGVCHPPVEPMQGLQDG